MNHYVARILLRSDDLRKINPKICDKELHFRISDMLSKGADVDVAWRVVIEKSMSMEMVSMGGGIGVVSYLTIEQYNKQLQEEDAIWYCPTTGIDGVFDDDYFEMKSNEKEIF